MAKGNIPPWLFSAAWISLAAAILIPLVVLVIILLGFTNPQPIGDLVFDTGFDGEDDRLFSGPRDCDCQGYLGDGEFVLTNQSANDAQVLWPQVGTALDFESQGLEGVPGTVEITIRQVEGPTDALYGISWNYDYPPVEGTTRYYGVNSNGYAGVYRYWADKEYFFGWSRYPHVRPSGEANRLRVDFDTTTETIMLNDELVTTLDAYRGGLPKRLNLVLETFNQGGVTIAVERVQVWAGR